MLLLAPPAGTLVDRLPRIAVMVGADLWRAALAALLILVGDSVVAVYVIAFGLSVGAVLFNPAANSALPTLVRDEELVAANSGIWTAAVLSQIALAPLAGVVYAAFGAGPAFGANAASFAVSAVLLIGLRLPTRPRSTQRRGFFTDALAGLRVLTADRLLRVLTAGQLLAALSAGATSALLVVLACDQRGLVDLVLTLTLPSYGSAGPAQPCSTQASLSSGRPAPRSSRPPRTGSGTATAGNRSGRPTPTSPTGSNSCSG